jgi:hypothetical protein
MSKAFNIEYRKYLQWAVPGGSFKQWLRLAERPWTNPGEF